MFAHLWYALKRPTHFIKTGLLEGVPAELREHFPARKLKIIAITGTDGKTTSSTLLYQVMRSAGLRVGLISTVAAYIGSEQLDTGFHVTTPGPRQLQHFLRQMVQEGIEYLVLETTSQGIYQHRLWGVHPWIAGLTNITPEHLDYHVTYQNYVLAKAELLKRAQVTVINADDEMSFSKLRKILLGRSYLTYSLTDVLPKKVEQALLKRFTQAYNWSNARLVYRIAQILHITDDAFIRGIHDFQGVPGRMEKVADLNGAEVIVDFAHTPNGLQEALTALHERLRDREQGGKLIAVFGCAGLRDVQKRPIMGRTAAELADVAIFTAEDPRTEDAWAIIEQMKSNLGELHAKVLSIVDRGEAVEFALSHFAKPGNIIGIFGKGHEQSMCYGKTEYPWNDARAVRAYIERTKGPTNVKPSKKQRARKGK